jgi:sulfur carrier protein ThiS
MERLNRRVMQVSVTHEGEVSVFEFSESVTIASVLEGMNIPASTVLTVVEESIVPHTSVITGDIEIELIIVSSGG